MGKTYPNPPIVEAVCEFRFAESTSWDLTLPGLLYASIRDAFPIRERRVVQQVSSKKSDDGIIQDLIINEFAVFFAPERTFFVQVGDHVLSINALNPYPSWSRFEPSIEHVFNEFSKLLQSCEISRIGLRYINRINIPLSQPELSIFDYFKYGPEIGDVLPETVDEFSTAIKIKANEGNDSCRIRFLSAHSDSPNTKSFLLDLDYALENPSIVQSTQDTLNWVHQAHTQIETFFEGCITDNLRQLFGETQA